MKKISLLLLLISNIALATFTDVDKQFVPYRNYLDNPGFEYAKTKWENSGGTFAITTTVADIAEGTSAASFDASATAQYIRSALLAVPSGLYGAECELRFRYKGGDSNYSVSVVNGSDVALATVNLTTSTNYVQKISKFTCPTSGSWRVRLQSSGNGAIVYLDSIYLGGEIARTAVVNPIVYEETRSVGSVGSVANDYAPLTDADFPVPANVRYWHLAGDSLEKSGNTDINLTQNGTPLFNGTGFWGRENVLSLNGSTQYLNSADPFFDITTQDMVTGGWFYIRNSADAALLSKFDSIGGSNRSWYIGYSQSSGLDFTLSGDGSTLAAQIILNVGDLRNKWSHIVGVVDNTNNVAKLYLNGNLVGSAAFNTNLFDTNQDFKVGTRHSTNLYPLSGSAQDIFFYKGGTLTDAQINALYSKRFTNHRQIAAGHVLNANSFPFSSLSGKVAYWNLNSTTTTSDGSGNGKTLTTVGTPVYTGLDIFGSASTLVSDGVDDRLYSTDSFFSSDIVTVGGWVYHSNWNPATSQFMLSTCLGNTTRSLYVVLEQGNFLRAYVSSDGSNANQSFIGISSASISPGWHHIVASHSGTTTKIYVDGVLAVQGTTRSLYKTTGAFVVNDAFTTYVTPLAGRFQDVFYVKDALSDSDIYKIYSSRLDLVNAVPYNSQDWSASTFTREDNKIHSQMKPDFIVDTNDSSVYLSPGLDPGSQVTLKLANAGLSGYNVQSEIFDTGELSAAPTFPLLHGLGRIPATVYVMSENLSTAGSWDFRWDLCSVNSTQISCDLSPLGTINSSNKVRIVASGAASGAFFTNATSTTPGLVSGGNVPGSSTGTAIAEGNIGQSVSSVISSASASSSTANTYTTVTGGSITLTQGTWLVGYSVHATIAAGTAGNSRLFLSSSGAVAGSEAYIGSYTGAVVESDLSKTIPIEVTGTQTLSLQIRGTSSSCMTILGNSLSGGLSDPDNSGIIWATRKG